MQPPGRKKFFGLPLLRVKAWATIAAILLVTILFLFGEDGVWRTMIRKKHVEQMEAHVDSLASFNKEMRSKMVALKAGDANALEEEARARGMIKPGEKVYLMQEKGR